VDEGLRENLKKTNNSVSMLKEGLKLLPVKNFTEISKYIKQSCLDPSSIVILTQFVKGKSFYDLLQTKLKNIYFNKVEILNILLQVYIPLSRLSTSFTHYDLHTANVMIIELPKNKYISLNYTLMDSTQVIIKTQYIAKIIDYGRAYTNQSIKFYNQILKTPECYETIGRKGYNFFEKPIEINAYISQYTKNESHDLRFAKNLSKMIKIPTQLNDVLKLIYYEDKYGTPENLKINSNINNINQLRDKLIELFKIEEYQEEVNEFISKKILFGTLEVDMLTNKEMRFKGQ
jgi:hypothetical protein